jgi:AcrR family transcriptional regulator
VSSTEISAETRRRVLEAAWERVVEHGPSGASVKDIAAEAGVSRQLVYFHYGSRAGLLTAMARHRDRGFGRAAAAALELPPRAALEATLRAWCAYVPDILPVARALEAALVTSDEGGTAWRERMGELHAVLARAVERVELAPGWTVRTATDWIWARVQPSTYAHLVGEQGWTHADYVERTIATVLRETLDDPQGGQTPLRVVEG